MSDTVNRRAEGFDINMLASGETLTTARGCARKREWRLAGPVCCVLIAGFVVWMVLAW